MAKIVQKAASDEITELNKKFQKFADRGWMCEGGEYNGFPCHHLFNNDTEEFIRADYDGNILIAVTIRTSVKDASEMAQIQAKISKIAREDE